MGSTLQGLKRLYWSAFLSVTLMAAGGWAFGKDSMAESNAWPSVLTLPILPLVGLALRGAASHRDVRPALARYAGAMGEGIIAMGAWWAAVLMGSVASATLTQWTGPLADEWLAALEEWVGLTQVQARDLSIAQGSYGLLAQIYYNIPYEVPLGGIWLAIVRPNPKVLWQVVAAFTVCVAVAMPMYLVLPAEGPALYYGWSGPPPSFLSSWHAMRGPDPYTVGVIDSYLSAPSFHIVFAVVFIRMWWVTPFRLASLVVNGPLMAAATWVVGWHYLMDLVVGALLACGSLALAWQVAR